MPRPLPIITSTEGGSKRTLTMELIRFERFCLWSIRDEVARYPATMQLTRSELVRACNAGLDFAAAMPVEREI